MYGSEDINEYDELFGTVFDRDGDPDELSLNHFEDFDNSISDIDFSQFKGNDFKKSFSKINKHIVKKKVLKKKRKPLTKLVSVEHRADIFGNKKKLAKVIVPRERSVIVEGVSKFILSQDKTADDIKQVGYYKGKKLKKLILTFNNDTPLPFNLELFNPSMPLDYLYSTSLNLNDKIQVAGGFVSYSDVLFNLLANPTMIVNATFVINGPLQTQQFSQSLGFTNKSIDGDVKIDPLNLNLSIDTMQVQSDVVYFDIMNRLNRPFIPDGMDVIKYTVLPLSTITMCFYYRQVSLKRVFLKEARLSKKLL